MSFEVKKTELEFHHKSFKCVNIDMPLHSVVYLVS